MLQRSLASYLVVSVVFVPHTLVEQLREYLIALLNHLHELRVDCMSLNLHASICTWEMIS
jgi:hypothetical protein